MNNNGPLDTLSGKMSGSAISRDIYRQRLEILKGFFPKLGQYPTRGQRSEGRGQGQKAASDLHFRPSTSALRLLTSAFSPPLSALRPRPLPVTNPCQTGDSRLQDGLKTDLLLITLLRLPIFHVSETNGMNYRAMWI